MKFSISFRIFGYYVLISNERYERPGVVVSKTGTIKINQFGRFISVQKETRTNEQKEYFEEILRSFEQ